MRYLIFSIFSFFLILNAGAQDFSNRGKDFWIGYGNHVRMFDPKLQVPTTNCYTSGNATTCPETMEVYITSDVNTSGEIEISSLNTIIPFQIIKNQITTVTIPRGAALPDEGKYKHGIHITALNPIVVYGFIYVSSVSGATLCLPTNVLGREYYSVNYTQISNEVDSYSYFFVVATEDNTRVMITPSADTKGGKPANIPFPVDLNKGEIYQVLGKATSTSGRYLGGDLTGSKIESVSNGTNGCKKIAVFCGSGKISVGCTSPTLGYHVAGSSDNLYQQIYPTSSWGKKYITVPTTNNTNVGVTNSYPQINYFRIILSKPGINVSIDGTVLAPSSFINGLYYDFSTNKPTEIIADNPILVAQYITTSGTSGTNNSNNPNCGNSGVGDPEMIYLNPTEQVVNSLTMNSMQPVKNTNISNHFINVVIKNEGTAISSFKIDGTSYSNRFKQLIQDPLYYYATINLTKGTHNVNSDSGFNAIAYGSGSAESYGYSAGANVKDLNQYIEIENPSATVKSLSTCINNNFKFSITLPFKPLSLAWDFKGNADLGPNPAKITNGGQQIEPDKTIKSSVDPTKDLYVYKLNQPLNFKSIGSYQIDVNLITQNNDGCSGDQTLNYEIQVYDIPKITGLPNKYSGCYTDQVELSATTQIDGGTPAAYIWTIEGQVQPQQTTSTFLTSFNSPGTKQVKLQVVSNFGCISDLATENIVLTDKPNVSFTPDPISCTSTPFKLTDNSSAVGNSTLSEWKWDYSDGQLSDVYSNTSVNPVKIFNVNSVDVTLTVKTTSGCSNSFTRTIVLSPNPQINISTLSNVCLPNGLATFVNNSTISAGNIISYSWDFGDVNATPSNSNTSSIPSPTHVYSTKGIYQVVLSATSDKGCTQKAAPFNLPVYAEPKSKIEIIKPEVCLNEQTSFKDLTQDENGNNLVKWIWKFIDGTTLDQQQFNRTESTPGSYTVQFQGISDKGCASDLISQSYTIHPLPTVEFNSINSLCETDEITFRSTSTPNVGTLTNWNWNLDNGSSAIFNNTNASDVKTIYTSWNVAPKNISLTVKNSKGCVNTKSIPIYIKPKPKISFTLPEVCLSDKFASFTPDVTIADNSTGFSYLWNFGDPNADQTNPNTSNSTIATHKYSAARIYTVELQVTSSPGCITNLKQQFTVNGATPLAAFNVLNENSLCSNTEVSLENLSSVDFGTVSKLEIYWDYLNDPSKIDLDDNPTMNRIYKHLYTNFQNPAAKTITIRVKAFSGGVCFDDELRTINLNGSPLVNFQSLPGICLESVPRQITQATYTDVVGISSGKELYTGTGVSSIGLFSPASAGAGTFPIKYAFTSSNGCTINSTQNIVVWPSPTANFAVDAVTCEKNPIVFTNLSTANVGNIVSWNWDFGDGTIPQVVSNGNPLSYTYSSYNSYNVTLSVITNNGCISPVKSTSVKVNPLPLVDFELPKVCMPVGKALFKNKSSIPDGTPLTYLWNFGDPADPSASVTVDGLHYYKSVQSYMVKLVATSLQSCVTTKSELLTDVFPQPKAAFKSVDSVCLGTTVAYLDNSNGLVRPIVGWNWNFDNGSSSILKDPKYKHPTIGTYQVSLYVTSSEGCLSDTVFKTIMIHPYPVVDAGADMFVLDDEQKQIQAKATGSNLTYQWTPSSYLDNTKISNPTIIFPQNDIVYTLSVTGRGACNSKDSIAITVLKKPKPPNTFTPNNDGINDTWDIIYLNQYPGSIVEVYDTQGKMVYRTKDGYTKKWDGTYRGSVLPSGTYYYVIDPKNGRNKMAGYVTIFK